MINETIAKFGKIDVIINNSAITHDSLFRDKTIEDFKDTLNVNVVGTFLVSKLVGEIMYENKFGRIINMTSTNGINTYFPMCIDYDASKSAIISLTHNLATQFAPYVCVNAIAPGFIATESEIGDMDEEFIRAEEEKVMVRRAGTPEEVAKLVSFLVSDDAGFINNTVIRIDGGIYGSC
jgi:3-oxoacyl-[acyl-carrier protein] reductase